MKYFKYVRICLAALVLLCITALLLDTTDDAVLRHYLGWMPKMQFLPAVLALNVVMVVAILVVTFLIGRLYCSIVCPMGIFQDIFTWFHKLIFGKKRPFRYRKPANWLRYTILVLFVLLMVFGLNGIAVLIAPYSAYARMVTNIHSSGLPLVVAIVTLVVIGLCSFMYGRLWCNTICPVGSLLGLVSKFRLFGIKIDADKCVSCRKCEKGCKAMCINIDNKTVDHSRCVDCWACLANCKVGAISLSNLNTQNTRNNQNTQSTPTTPTDPSRRKFLATTAAVGAATTLHAQGQKLDGGLAVIEDKQVPDRQMPLKPAGSISLKNFESRCTACQLCVSKCPEHVLRPSTSLATLMQPYMAFDQGYCRTACTRCSEVCPAGAIQPIAHEQKTAISIGHAVVLPDNCISCGVCARHCPSAAISMVDGKPAVNESRCLGCGACEYYCPARPLTAIYVEGRERHVEI
ncbi:MAG: 4Fe-4S binding protein [Bacteroidales bacterium]|nr:4Fe-4S binding protein [Bacteroidales bacterium]